jgi:hypothetical protein
MTLLARSRGEVTALLNDQQAQTLGSAIHDFGMETYQRDLDGLSNMQERAPTNATTSPLNNNRIGVDEENVKGEKRIGEQKSWI